MPPLRIALVIPGAVSLGAYEAGALTALLRVVEGARGRIVVDTVTGASAGAISAALVGHALVSGTGEGDLHELWVERGTIDALLKGGTEPGRPWGPLSPKILEDWAAEAMKATGQAPIQPGPVYFVATIANLGGLRYRLAQIATGRGTPADTYRDAKAFVLDDTTDWDAVRHAAAAASAHLFAFSPVGLLRRRDEYPPQVEMAQSEELFWYTDGGTVYNTPIGFALDAVFDPGSLHLPDRGILDGERLFLLVDPHAGAPPARWPVGGGDPTYRQATLRAALTLSRAQSTYDDLRRVEKTNTLIANRRELQGALSSLLPPPSVEAAVGPEPGSAAALLEAVSDSLIRRKAAIRAIVHGEGDHTESILSEVAGRSEGPISLADRLDFILDEVTGTGGKELVEVEMVSPDLDPSGAHPADLLAGDALGHFLGFAIKDARQADYGLGYRNFRTWWESWAPEHELGDVAVPPDPLEARPPMGHAGLKTIPRLKRWRLALRLLPRYVRAFW